MFKLRRGEPVEYLAAANNVRRLPLTNVAEGRTSETNDLLAILSATCVSEILDSPVTSWSRCLRPGAITLLRAPLVRFRGGTVFTF